MSSQPRAYSPQNLTPLELLALRALARESMPLTDLATAIEVDRARASSAARRLRLDGLVHVVHHGAWQPLYRLTPRGRNAAFLLERELNREARA